MTTTEPEKTNNPIDAPTNGSEHSGQARLPSVSILDATRASFSNLFKKHRWLLWIFLSIAGVFLLTITEFFAVPETMDLTSSGTWRVALAYSVPIMMAGLGGLFAERAGVVNIGLEGMMILGTWFGAWGSNTDLFITQLPDWFNGPWSGLFFGVIGGGLGGLLHALATVTFGIDHIVSGVAINLMAFGTTRYLSSKTFATKPLEGGGLTKSPSLDKFQELDIPLLSGILESIEKLKWFFISDFARILHGLTTKLSWATVLAYAFVPFVVWLLWRTSFGLRLRSCGEHPVAADSLGVNVYKYKYYAVTISGMCAGFAGAFLAIHLTAGAGYSEGQTNGRGFIGLATLIFGNWKPVGTALGAVLFGFADVVQLRDVNAIHALLLLVSILLFAFTLIALIRYASTGFSNRKYLIQVIGTLIGAATIFVWYMTTKTVPTGFPQAIPHMSVLAVLIFGATRLRAPAAVGMQYRRGHEN